MERTPTEDDAKIPMGERTTEDRHAQTSDPEALTVTPHARERLRSR